MSDKFEEMSEEIDKLGGPDKVKDDLGKAANAANKVTGGRYEDEIDKGRSLGGHAVEGLSHEEDHNQ